MHDGDDATIRTGSPRWPVYAGAAALVLAGAAGLGMWTIAGTTRVVPPRPTIAKARPRPVVSPTIAPAKSPAQELSEAFLAATGEPRAFTRMVEGESVTTTPLRIIALPFGRALLTKRETQDGCHACSGHVGVYYLGERDGAITVVRRFEEAVPGWGWGAAPAFEVTTRFTVLPAIHATGSDMHQGYAETGATITELTPAGPVASDFIALGFDNSGAITGDSDEQACRIDGTIADIVRDRSFDVVMRGTVSYRTHYEKRGGRFVATTQRETAC